MTNTCTECCHMAVCCIWTKVNEIICESKTELAEKWNNEPFWYLVHSKDAHQMDFQYIPFPLQKFTARSFHQKFAQWVFKRSDFSFSLQFTQTCQFGLEMFCFILLFSIPNMNVLCSHLTVRCTHFLSPLP